MLHNLHGTQSTVDWTLIIPIYCQHFIGLNYLCGVVGWFFADHFCCFCLLTVDILWLITVAALWGFTNPFLKKGGRGIEHIQSNSRLLKMFYELMFLISNYKVSCDYVIILIFLYVGCY